MKAVKRTFAIQKAQAEDEERLAEVSALAFEHDPLTGWLNEGGSDLLAMERQMFHAEYRITRRFGLIYTDADRMGVAIWKPPGARSTMGDRILQGWTMLGTIRLSRRTLAKIRLFVDIEKARPKEAHYYLNLLAVHPELQGKGLGSALMQPILDICDQEGIPAYLETGTETNVAFYTRKGFVVRQEIITRDGASRVWTMWRDSNIHNTQEKSA